ncbi:MAG: hypothetical protein KF796_19670 [Ramlibacter sp.]|nr:hypothetical protein [Ramlibacter sp.]
MTAPPVAPDPVPAVPEPVPQRSDWENFAARGDALLTWLVPFVAALVALRTYLIAGMNWVATKLAEITALANSASLSEQASAANAAAAAASASAALWVYGTNYAAGTRTFSPTNWQTYIDNVGGVSNTDPAADTSGRWISGMLPTAEAIGLPDLLPTAFFNFAGGQIDRRLVNGRSTPKTTISPFGLVVPVAAQFTAVEYDPATKRCKGFRGEQAINYIGINSETMATDWIAGNTALTAAATVGPDGLMSGVKVEATTSTTGTTIKVVTATAAAQFYSIAVKQGSGPTEANSFAIYNLTTAANVASVEINYATGVVTQFVGAGATAEALGGGWWRLRIQATAGVSPGDSLNLYACQTGGPQVTGQYAYVAQPALADKRFANYYPTAGANVPLAADSLVLDLAAHPTIINPREYTVVVSFDGTNVPSIGTDVHVLALSGAGGSELVRIAIINGGVYAQAISASANQAFFDLGAVVAGRNVIAFSVAAGNFLAVARGGAVQTSAAGLMPAVTALGFACVPGSAGSEFAFPIERVMPYPRVCTPVELRALVNNF